MYPIVLNLDATNVNYMVALKKKSVSKACDLSSWNHECLYRHFYETM